MKVFMLIKKLRYSGAYKVFLWLAQTLVERGMDVTLCTFMPTELSTIPPGVKWLNCAELCQYSFPKRVHAIRKIVKDGDYDVSISFLLDGNVYNILACMGLRTKSVVCERNDPFKPRYWALRFWKPLFRYANGAVYQLPRVAEYYDNISSPTAVIPNPIEVKAVELRPWEERKKVILTLGRLDLFQKRQDVLIRAFEIFLRTHSDYELHLYGNGDDETKIRDMVASLGLTNSVKLMGVTLEPLMVYKEARIFALSSDFEGIPNALMEAMAIGLPCVSTDCRPGGAFLLVKDGINGLLVPAGDYVSLAEQMSRLADNPSLAESIGEKAKQIVQDFSPNSIADMWVKYICDLAQ